MGWSHQENEKNKHRVAQRRRWWWHTANWLEVSKYRGVNANWKSCQMPKYEMRSKTSCSKSPQSCACRCPSDPLRKNFCLAWDGKQLHWVEWKTSPKAKQTRCWKQLRCLKVFCNMFIGYLFRALTCSETRIRPVKIKTLCFRFMCLEVNQNFRVTWSRVLCT